MRHIWLSITLLILVAPTNGQSRFYPDDPIPSDNDRLSIDKPAEREISEILDFLQASFVQRPGDDPIPSAENVNTLGEVPDSSWFTSRLGRREMSLQELVQGPNQGNGPDNSAPWTIIAAKSEGVTPGFTIRDARNEIYFIKFDPRDYPQLATSSEVVVTRFFYAFGYFVPENYLTYFDPTSVEIADSAMLEDVYGRERSMKPSDLKAIVRKAGKLPDGRIQVIASRRLAGEPLGHFRYFGTRSDDPNDIFPHENRRELRGLRLFAAWLNHDDTRSINSLDMFMRDENGEKGHVRHYLIDFGSSLGSGSIKPQSRRAGNEYIIEWTPMVRSGLTLGLWDRPWRRVRYPKHPGLGRFEADYFEPELWKPEYPNPAFERMRLGDAFWAARIIQRFDRDMVAAIVGTGQYWHADSQAYLIKTLMKRRNKIVAHYFGQINPLADFEVSSDLAFQNLGEKEGLADGSEYLYQWSSYEPSSHSLTPIGSAARTSQTRVSIPDTEAAWVHLELQTLQTSFPNWAKSIKLYLQRREGGWRLIGIERQE